MGFSDTFKKLVGIEEVPDDDFSPEEIAAAKEQAMKEETTVRKPIGGLFSRSLLLRIIPKRFDGKETLCSRYEHFYTCCNRAEEL